ncbi:hypothetical protein R1flu_025049 [Riccia fluitans]|uniref:Uncharacterized protein n=1 Tax=Riccia fluitans TaxID=41844 RepID=A0ABD1XWM3_9MARC
MMVATFNRHINNFNDPKLVPSKLLWEYQVPPLMVWVKEEVLSDRELDAYTDPELTHAKEKEELNMEAREKGMSSNSNKEKLRANLVHPWHRKLGRE